MSFRHVAIAVATLFAAACGGSGSIASGDLISKYAAAYCQKGLSCCSGNSGLPTEAQCEQLVTAQIQTSFNAEINDTKLAYHGDVAASCLDAINSASCGSVLLSDITISVTACDGLFTGTVANGGSCGADFGAECQSGLCSMIDGSTNTGVCAAAVATGSACLQGTSFGEMCADGIQDDSGASCVCAARKANGATCSSSDVCASGYCDSTAGACAAPPATLSASVCAQLFTGN